MNAVRCIYCGDVATTRDHVPPKCLLDRPLPSNLPTLPSCSKCNSGFSLDEQYFLVLLTEISNQRSLVEKRVADGIVDRTLKRAPALKERFSQALDFDDDGTRVIHPEHERIKRVIQKIGLGLFIIRYNKIPRLSDLSLVSAYPYCFREDRPLPYFISTFTERFQAKQWRHIQKGIFSYIFVRDPKSSSKVWCVMDFHSSMWGVVHLPNPKSRKVRGEKQLWLFESL